MNKKEFVKGLADNMGVTVKEAAITFDCFMDQLMATIATGDKFTIVGFGSFYSEDKAARTARNPKTGEPIEVPAKRVPKFKYSEKFKKTIFAGGLDEVKAEAVEEIEEVNEVGQEPEAEAVEEVEEIQAVGEAEDDNVAFDTYDEDDIDELLRESDALLD